MGHGGLNQGSFLGGKLFLEPGLGASAGRLGLAFVDCGFIGGEHGDDGNAFLGDIGAAAGDEEAIFVGAAAGDDFAVTDEGDEGGMHRVDAHLALAPGQGDHVYVLGIDRAGRGNDLEFQGRPTWP
jgi:hypothetical protein